MNLFDGNQHSRLSKIVLSVSFAGIWGLKFGGIINWEGESEKLRGNPTVRMCKSNARAEENTTNKSGSLFSSLIMAIAICFLIKTTAGDTISSR